MTDIGTRGDLRYLDPATLVLGANVRLDPQQDKWPISSVRDLGVLNPVVATEDPVGAVLVRMSQRRTLPAVELALRLIPAVVSCYVISGAAESRVIISRGPLPLYDWRTR